MSFLDQYKEPETIEDYDFSKMSPVKICEAIRDNDELRLTVAKNMREHGNSFIQALGVCLITANPENRYILTDAFLSYICRYEPKRWK